MMYERMIEAYPTELTDSMPALEFQCGDAPECHDDNHVYCTPGDGAYDDQGLRADDGSAVNYFVSNAL